MIAYFLDGNITALNIGARLYLMTRYQDQEIETQTVTWRKQ